MAFKRIVANSEEDLKTIMSNVKSWFKETNDYKTACKIWWEKGNIWIMFIYCIC